MSENPKIQVLSNDLVRRLLNTQEELPKEYREDIINKYGRKLLTSGYGREQIAKIIVDGIKGYEGRLRKSRNGIRKLHRTGTESMGGRIKKKLLSKTNWFKSRRKEQVKDDEINRKGTKGREARHLQMELKTRSIIL